MNKRMKKKWSRVARLETKVAQLMAENVLLTEAVKGHSALIEGIHACNTRNVRATNARFDSLENDVKLLKQAQTKKKSWFGRH